MKSFLDQLSETRDFLLTPIQHVLDQFESLLITQEGEGKRTDSFVENQPSIGPKTRSRTRSQTRSFINNNNNKTSLSKGREANFSEIPQKMEEIWRIETEKKTKQPIKLTGSLSSRLLSCLQQLFSGCLDKWRDYCRSIASSKFLMGEKDTSWQAWLPWAIKPEIIERVRAGEFDIGDRTPQAELDEKNRTEDLVDHIQNCSGPLVWKEALTCVLNRVGAAAFRSWIKPLKFLEEFECIIKLQAPSKFCATWVQEKYDSLFVEAFSGKGIRRISILSESS